MNIGQTSIVVFLSKLLGAALGFLATLIFARILGAEVIGLYALILTVVGWLTIAGQLGIGGAVKKRISEGEERGAYLTAATLFLLALATVVSVGVVLAGPLLETYIDEFDQYVAISVVWFVVALVFIRLFYKMVFRTLQGERKVHIAGLLDPVKTGGRGLVQIGFVLAGYGLLGMLAGYMLAGIFVGLLGLLWVSTRFERPGRRHFRSLFDYAKFSWLGGLRSRTFNEVDILVLGIFVQTSLVGVYSVSWSIANFLSLFGNAIRSTLFPEISHKSAQESDQAVAGLVEDALAYTGLFAIPGLIGGVILGDRLLRIYGEEFVEGAAVLGLLIVAVLLYSYQKQLMNSLNGLDRPDVAFRINAVFIVLNASLNVVLIWQYGIEGAAVATALSVAVSLVLSYRALSRLITFDLPYRQVAYQWVGALTMGAVVLGALELVEMTDVVANNAVIVLTLVGLGAGVYFLVVLALSREFRGTVDRNLPVDLPYLG